MDQLLLGFGREDITPDGPVRMNSQCTSDEIWHPIFAHALYFQQGAEKALIINLDLRELYAHFLDYLRPVISQTTGITPEKILLKFIF